MLSGCIIGCCFEDVIEKLEADDDEDDGEDDAAEANPNKKVLNCAADYMEDPGVQARMQEIV